MIAAHVSRGAVFLDRDGVINRDSGYVGNRERVEFIDGSIGAISRLHRAGFRIVVVSNQSGVARGKFTEDDVRSVHAEIGRAVRDAGGEVAAFMFCPHLPGAAIPAYDQACSCRKPAPGMLLRARDALNIDLARSLLVGDRRSDVEAGRAAGVNRCFLVRSGKPLRDDDLLSADGVFEDLADACSFILSSQGKKPVPALRRMANRRRP